MEFRIVVWNLKLLSQRSGDERLRRAKEAFRILADGNTAVFALVELAPKPDTILEDLAAHLGNEWIHYYGAVREGDREVGLLLNTRRLSSAATLKLKTAPHNHATGANIEIGRSPAGVFQIYYNHKASFLLAVVHFKATRSSSDAYTRQSLAEWLRREMEKFYSDIFLPIVIVGDFNGEPWEVMFSENGFRAFRRVEAALRSKEELKLYNPMWRLLPDQAPIAARRPQEINQTSGPFGTLPNSIRHSLVDGVLVSSEWLTKPSYILHDERLEILTHELWHHVGEQGAHYARPAGVEEALAITDHLPIAVNLEVI